MNDARLEQLKSKYQSVLDLMKQLDVRLLNLHVQDNKLVLRGQAKTNLDSNKVWDQIKVVDRNYQQDLMAEILFEKEEAPKPQAPEPKTYTVQTGDTLSGIARKHYGDAGKYMKIFEANRDKLSDPNKIQPGQVLTIPPA